MNKIKLLFMAGVLVGGAIGIWRAVPALKSNIGSLDGLVMGLLAAVAAILASERIFARAFPGCALFITASVLWLSLITLGVPIRCVVIVVELFILVCILTVVPSLAVMGLLVRSNARTQL